MKVFTMNSLMEFKDHTYKHLNLDALDIDKNFISRCAELKNIPKGTYIYRNIRNTRKVYLIKRGKVKLGYYSENGKEAISSILGQKDIFGNVFGVPKRGDEYAQTLAPTDLYVMNYPDFCNWLRDHPSNAEKLLELINRRFQQLEQKYLSVVLMDVRNRIIAFLKYLAQHHGTDKGNVIAIPNFLTHQEIAELNGTSRQTVTTIFLELKKQKLLDYNRSQLKVAPRLLKMAMS